RARWGDVVDRLTPFAARAWCGALVLGAALVAGPAHAAVYVVNSTGDQAAAPPVNNGVCNSTAGTCTLRAAIEEANGTGGADTINFNSGGGGLQPIVLGSALPNITSVVTINGTTQPGFAGTPLIEVRGPAAGAAGGLDLQGGSTGSTIRGLIINNFTSGIA